MTSLSLKSLLVPSKSVEVDFPGFPGFKITLSFLSRETLLGIRKKATKTTFKNRQASEDFDEEIFLQLYTQNAIKGWTGLKLEYVDKLAPVNLEGLDLNDYLEFTEENALYLMKNSSNFDAFITEQVSDLANFTTNSSAK